MHETEFNRLLTMASSESRILTISRTGVVTQNSIDRGEEGAEREGMSKDRWTDYQQLFSPLNLQALGRSEGRILFEVDATSMWNGDSEKGVEYSQVQPTPIVSSLDSINSADIKRDKYGGFSAYKALKGHWYLYVHVN
jgi:hypothetical protein